MSDTQQPTVTVPVVPAHMISLGGRTTVLTYLEDMARSRHFVWALALGRVKVSVLGTKLGLAWLVLTPLANAALFYLVFGVFLGESVTIENYALFLAIGVLSYTVFQRAIASAAGAPRAHRDFTATLGLPKAAGDAPAVLTELLAGAWVAPVLVACWALGGGRNPIDLALALVAGILFSLFTLGLGLIVAALARALPDASKIFPFALRAGAFLSGVYFPLQLAADKLGHFGQALSWNPVAVYIDLLREALVYHSGELDQWIAALIWAAAAVVAGLLGSWVQEGSRVP